MKFLHIYRNYKQDYAKLMVEAKRQSLQILRDTQGNPSFEPHFRLGIKAENCGRCNGTVDYGRELKQMQMVANKWMQHAKKKPEIASMTNEVL